MPPRDSIHYIVKQAIINDGWKITDDPYVISYGERFLFIDLAATISSTFNQAQGSFSVQQKKISE
ncbi:element excision factor XisH family protein [Nostoc sp.]|uniref:element excision factor XisH family protein n=1 Tax=Nostoc sp. TaxID=1180 RepID=UPI002FF48B05